MTTADDTLAVARVSDRTRWNALVAGFPDHDIRQGFEWGEVRRACGWRPYRLAVLDGERCVAAVSVLARSLPLVGSLLYAPRGPLYDPSRPAALDRLLAEVCTIGKSERAIVLRVSPPVLDDERDRVRALADHGFLELTAAEESTTWNTPRHTQWLDLRRPEAELWRALRRRYREYIAAARRRDVVIEPSDRIEDWNDFYDLLVATARLKGLPIRGKDYYASVWQEYRRGNAGCLLVARVAGVFAGAMFWVGLGRQLDLLYASVRSATAESLKHHLAPALYWESIVRARAAGYERADFGSSGVRLEPRENDPGYGVYRFKQGMGAAFHRYVPYRDLVLRPLAYRALRFSERHVLPLVWRVGTYVSSRRADTLGPRTMPQGPATPADIGVSPAVADPVAR